VLDKPEYEIYNRFNRESGKMELVSHGNVVHATPIKDREVENIVKILETKKKEER